MLVAAALVSAGVATASAACPSTVSVGLRDRRPHLRLDQPLHVFLDALERRHGLADRARDLRNLVRPEDYECEHRDDDEFRAADSEHNPTLSDDAFHAGARNRRAACGGAGRPSEASRTRAASAASEKIGKTLSRPVILKIFRMLSRVHTMRTAPSLSRARRRALDKDAEPRAVYEGDLLQVDDDR